ncbi:MAG: hypothetical protein PVI93_23410, partial [Desulfobacterales bacterium]
TVFVGRASNGYVFEAVMVEQGEGDILIAGYDRCVVTGFLQSPNDMLKKMHMGRMNDVKKNDHIVLRN